MNLRRRPVALASLLLALTLAATLAATVAVAWIGTRDGTLAPQETWTGVITVFAAIIAVAVPLLRGGDRREESLEEAVRACVPALAEKVTESWKDEERHRGLYEGVRAELRWEAAPGSDRTTRLAAALPTDGTLARLTGGFARHVRTGAMTRLVVTGEAGAGKTSACVLLTLELGDTGPLVPVPFQLSSWDPEVPLYEWMTGELRTAYPFVGSARHGGRVAAELALRHVLPVLDGLDEVADPVSALRRIDEETEGRSFVLSCRTETFAVANAGHVLRRGLVVRLQPLRAEESRDHLLRHEPGANGDRLAPLAARLRENPAGPLAEALRTPLMLSLAVARGGEPVPAELLAATGPDAADRIRRHLLDSFVGKAFTPRPDEKPPPTPPDEARRYLEFLAGQVDESGRLAWWRLHRAVPGWVFRVQAVVLAVVVCSGLAAAHFGVFGRPWLGFWIGFAAGGVGALVVKPAPQDAPRRARPGFRLLPGAPAHELFRLLGFGAMGAAACVLIVSFLYASPFHVVVGGALSGLTFAMARHVSEPVNPLEVVTPASLLANDRRAVLAAWVAGGVSGAFSGAYLGAALQDGHRPELGALPIMELPPTALALLGAVAGCGLGAAGLGLMALRSSAWGRFTTTRLWLAAHGSAPLRLMRFLEDARRRGVLQRVSGSYEFRHRLLRDHLAEHLPKVAAEAATPPDDGSLTPTSTGPDNVH
ncbi:NACHT domain-containing protein [Nonomuraea sp. NPDC047897]|uniref:NACHT domain-containing protein n=1 Tax=Nonomuraea sp. NPDC047897 TaxID=3364346 RepID=UPI003723C720